MAFANLFAGLSHVDQDVGHRSFHDEGKSSRQTEHTGPGHKRRRHEAQRTWTYNTKPFPSASPAKHPQMSNTEQDEFQNHSNNNSGHSDMCHKGPRDQKNYKQQQQQQKKKNYKAGDQKHQHHFRGRGAHDHRGGRNYGDRRRSYQQRPRVPIVKTFSQDFKDQNALLVDGQLLCRHFIWGRCIKGDGCQLKHIQCYNDLIKELCKFYVQGLCTRGENCPYMHNILASFPCKFFHSRGKCLQEADCRFSHEPLNETTGPLLDKFLQRENELANKAKLRESQEPPVNTEGPETELGNVPDVLTQPLRPSFYSRDETNTEPESSLCETEEQSEITEASEPEASAQPRGAVSPELHPEKLVCYSVEALMGLQLFKPFPSFSTKPAPPESHSERTHQSTAPDSGGSCTSAGSPFGHASKVPAAQSESNVRPRPDKGRVALYSPIVRAELYKPLEKMFKCLPSLQTCTERKQAGEASASSCGFQSGPLYSPAAPAAEFVSPGSEGNAKLPVETSPAVKSENALPFAASEPRGQTCTSTDPGSRSRPQASEKRPPPPPPPPPLLSSSRLSEMKAPVESVSNSTKTSDAAVCHLTSKPPTECPTPLSLKPGTQQSHKIVNRAFYNLFSDGLKTSLDLTATSRPRSSSSSSSSSFSSSSAHTRSSDLKPVVEPDTISDRPFLSLFAAPLSSPPPSRPRPSSPGSSSQESDPSSEHRSNAETLRPLKRETELAPHRSTYPKVSPHLKNANDSSETESQAAEEGNRTFQPCTPASRGDGADPSPSQAHQQLLHTSAPKGSAPARSSVLKTLFLRLNPFEDGGEQQEAGDTVLPSASEIKENTNIGVVDEEQQQKKRKKEKTGQRLHQPAEGGVATGTRQPPDAQAPPLSVEPRAGPTPDTAAPPGPQVREGGTHKLPFRPVTLLTQRHAPRRAEERKSVADVPLRDLFRTLDTTVFKH